METAVAPARSRPIVVWLLVLAGLVVTMVAIGGITRLTGSGLSIVVWEPIMGAIPPTSEQAWQAAFERYQQFPQYVLQNRGMTLAQFKGIFFWEYLHRLIGRAIGVAYVVPWVVFAAQKRIPRGLSSKLAVGLALGGSQGVLGWCMVQSGLVDKPHVSHYRLAAHLLLAFVVLAYLLWTALELLPGEAPPRSAPRGLRRIAAGLLSLTLVQVLYGAFTAGLKAGLGYNTFPKMAGEWFPSAFFRLEPAWKNAFENPAAVQFIHRTLGFAVVTSVTAFWLWARTLPLSPRQRSAIHALFAITCAQFLLGVATLLLFVPVSVATLHQVGACLTFAVFVVVVHASKSATASARNGLSEPLAAPPRIAI